MKQKDLPIKTTNIDLGKYTTLILGSPVWARTCAPFIKTFLSSAQNIKGKKTAVFITGGGLPEPHGKPRTMMQHHLTNAGATLSDSFLGLQMRKGRIKEGENQIEGFIRSLPEH
jgi:flavorubredoxin